MLAYGVGVDVVDDYIRIGESTAVEALRRFVQAVIDVFAAQYLRRPTDEDICKLLSIGESQHEFVEESSQIASKSPARGPSFNTYEDRLLVNAWLNIGLDPIQDTKKMFEAQEDCSDIDIEEEINICNPVARPLGKKTEKRKLKETSDQLVLIEKLHLEKKERDEKKLAIMKEKVEVDKEKLRVRKLEVDNRKFETEMRIMSMDTSKMNNEEKTYYSKLQMKILQGDN
ncbi:hypothetical protein ACLB2K_064634 [Fragaria x ananassa]